MTLWHGCLFLCAYVLAGLVVAHTVATAGAGLGFAAERGVQNLGRWPARRRRQLACALSRGAAGSGSALPARPRAPPSRPAVIIA